MRYCTFRLGCPDCLKECHVSGVPFCLQAGVAVCVFRTGQRPESHAHAAPVRFRELDQARHSKHRASPGGGGTAHLLQHGHAVGDDLGVAVARHHLPQRLQHRCAHTPGHQGIAHVSRDRDKARSQETHAPLLKRGTHASAGGACCVPICRAVGGELAVMHPFMKSYNERGCAPHRAPEGVDSSWRAPMPVHKRAMGGNAWHAGRLPLLTHMHGWHLAPACQG